MSARITLATARRVGAQLRRDRRTLALVLVVPPALLTLLRYVLDQPEGNFQRVGAPLIGIFPLVIMFLIASIAMLRERTSGTLERLMSMPLGKLDLLAGYGLAFGLLAALQGTISALVGFWLLGIDTAGPEWAVVALAIGNAILGMALGLLLSSFAATEFQAVQFMPAFVMPQLLLAGLFAPREQMPELLQRVSDAMPFTYAYDGLARIAADDTGAGLWLDVGVVAGGIVLALALGAMTLRRRTA
ncbi:MAG: type transport system permease protein [Solirubrobacteraceae bacterium]|nr:type transport system permease protein [Solirubrobacteraceae bacterium]